MIYQINSETTFSVCLLFAFKLSRNQHISTQIYSIKFILIGSSTRFSFPQILSENNFCRSIIPSSNLRSNLVRWLNLGLFRLQESNSLLNFSSGAVEVVDDRKAAALCSSVAVPMTSERNRATGPTGFDFDPVVLHSSSHLVHGGQLVQPVPAGGFSRNHAHGVPYLHDMRLHGYQVAGLSRNSRAFIMPRPMRPQQGPHNVYYPPLPPPPLLQPPMLPVQAQNMDGHVHLPSTSRRRSTRTSSRHLIQNDADPGPSYVGPALPHGVMVYEARRQQLMIDSIERRRSLAFPHFRVLPEEELLALGEQTGNTDSGLSDNFISDHLKTRTFASFRHHSEDLMPADEEPNFCVICQMELEDQEKIGILDCCHEYHEKCIKKWLVVKNNCPICKSTALR
ncbi:hypothetical protein L1987_74082 [Smallanthus sonchifolius]|uniref:Uncharacterized protein n=1 Tax=Smallanthus sonchifolius TaxID=185202 RepID=A0ACB9A2V7_9ASTR|nr:hypothetical protein L1987_74082 [Smallanthus sonchifolius]